MKITCEGCKSSINVPDEKIPAGKAVRVVCPRCQHANLVKSSKSQERAPLEVPPQALEPEDLDEDLFLDALHEGGRTALICTGDSDRAGKLEQLVSEMGFGPITEPDPDRAVRRLRHGGYDLVILEEPTGADDRARVLLGFVQHLSMAQKRESFFCLLTEHERSMDSFAAFRRQVDLVIHPNDLERGKMLLERELKSKKKFYRVFQDALNERGQI
ncbi:MJ0042 family finger-like domain-containing protein [Desulfacinum hydrothermale DSM 13146]|uniref:MJ0042 family finger-like domain-containing protein n=1 Tax=Desulfacinum hydrothermale DSM 13146 TaxID=1121390 RepID=A0A1W1X9H7_9BACT|nr:MJ0042 family finger-like domain-containing protein [Desulfacinum hydrothermale DSM 13146]